MPPLQAIHFPFLGNSRIMAIVILVHVFFAFVAVGGISLSVVAEWIGWRKKDSFYDQFARAYTKFIAEMMKIGGVLGVAIVVLLIILFPEFTKRLYHIFAWPLLLEVLLFLILMSSSIAYRLTWDTMKKRNHILLGSVSAIAAILAGVVINAAWAFMLTPGTYFENPSLLKAVFNPILWSSTTHLLIPCWIHGAALPFIYAVIQERRSGADKKAHYQRLATFTGTMTAVAMLLQPLSGLSFLLTLWSVDAGIFAQITTGLAAPFFWTMVSLGLLGVVCVLIYFLSQRQAKKVLLLGVLAFLTAFSLGGYTRERARKPYLIYNHMTLAEGQTGFASDKTSKQSESHDLPSVLGDLGCLACHSFRGTGGSFGPKLDQKLFHYSAAELTRFLQNPPAGMPPFSGSETERTELLELIDQAR